MFYTVYRQLPDEGDEVAPIPLRRVAFGPKLAQNIHVIEADGRPNPSQKRWLDAALMALHLVKARHA